jgi:hypothetical protein
VDVVSRVIRAVIVEVVRRMRASYAIDSRGGRVAKRGPEMPPDGDWRYLVGPCARPGMLLSMRHD